ncbi:MAG: DNA repair protein RecO [Candidatus Dojkabacteria bacterium]
MKSSQSYKGIIYRVFNSGSQDKVVYMILEDGAKFSSIAKSVKRDGSRKAHALEIGNLVTAKALPGQLATLTEMSLLNEFTAWKKEFKSMALLQLLCEVIDDFCYEDNKDDELYKILYNTLEYGAEKQLFAVSIFLIKLLDHTGVLPELDKSLVDEEELNSENIYNIPGEVGYVSDKTVNSNHQYSSSEKIEPRIYKTQRYVLSVDVKEGLKIKLSGEEESNLFKLHLNWLENLMSVKIKSREILNTII